MATTPDRELPFTALADQFQTLALTLIAVTVVVALLTMTTKFLQATERSARQATQRQDSEKTRRALEDRHDRVIESYGAYCSDVGLQLDHPALDDLTRPQTVAFLEAYGTAAESRNADDQDAYATAVRRLAAAWRSAAAGVPPVPPVPPR